MVLPPLLLLNNSFIIDFSNIFHASVVRHPTGGGGASITAAMFEAGLLLWALSALCGFFGHVVVMYRSGSFVSCSRLIPYLLVILKCK